MALAFTKKNVFGIEGLPIEQVENTCPALRIYRHPEFDLIVHEMDLPVGLDWPVDIGFVTDLHFNYANEEDQNDPEVMDTIAHRRWLHDGKSVLPAVNALKAANLLDQVVIGGDTLDFLSHGTLELIQRHVFKPYPDILCVLGGHELTKQMQTGKPDQTPLSERLALLEAVWPHSIHYCARLIIDRVLCIGLDNSRSHYAPGTAARLEHDLQIAREFGLAVLLFQHEPINTGDPRYAEPKPIWLGDPNYAYFDLCCGKHFIGCPERDDEEDKAVYHLIRHSADVIRGIFTGHLHNVLYNEVLAEEPDGTPRPIPQLIQTCNAYMGVCGQVTRIHVH